MGDSSKSGSAQCAYSVREVAQMLGVSEHMVYVAGARGDIPGRVKVGSLVRFSREAIDGWLSRKGARDAG
jgi:excisionase family DNA binding protein